MKCTYGTGQTNLEDCRMAYIHVDGYYPTIEIALSLLCPNRVPCHLCGLRTHPDDLKRYLESGNAYCGNCAQRWSLILSTTCSQPVLPPADFYPGQPYPHKWRSNQKC
jgi:hypothetical protein